MSVVEDNKHDHYITYVLHNNREQVGNNAVMMFYSWDPHFDATT